MHHIEEQKTDAWPQTCVYKDRKGIREITNFTAVTNNIQHLNITLTKQVKDSYDNKFKCKKTEDGNIFNVYEL